MSPRRSSRLTAGAEYPVEFKQFWALYPKRAGANPKRRAFAAWWARLEEGTEIRRVLEGARAYARFCAATGKLNTEHVLQAATFLGEDRHFELPWSLPSKPAKQRFAPKPPPESEAMKVRSEYPGRGRVISGRPTAIAEVLNGNADRSQSEADAELRIANWEQENPGRAELAWREAPALVGWSLVINERMRSVFGRCHYGRRALHLAAWHVEHGEWADVLDTLRHEAAHALAGPRAGHGPTWRSWARRLGAEARRCGSREAWAKSPAAKDGPKWIVRCQKCGLATYRRRRSAGWEKAEHRGGGGRLEWLQTR